MHQLVAASRQLAHTELVSSPATVHEKVLRRAVPHFRGRGKLEQKVSHSLGLLSSSASSSNHPHHTKGIQDRGNHGCLFKLDNQIWPLSLLVVAYVSYCPFNSCVRLYCVSGQTPPQAPMSESQVGGQASSTELGREEQDAASRRVLEWPEAFHLFDEGIHPHKRVLIGCIDGPLPDSIARRHGDWPVAPKLHLTGLRLCGIYSSLSLAGPCHARLGTT
jgi:hypothetical protein